MDDNFNKPFNSYLGKDTVDCGLKEEITVVI